MRHEDDLKGMLEGRTVLAARNVIACKYVVQFYNATKSPRSFTDTHLDTHAFYGVQSQRDRPSAPGDPG